MPEILQGNNTEARLLADERFLRKIAHLYYEDGNSQEAVAEMENCSRQTVGKALQKARERGIVRITVMPDARTGYLRNLSREGRVQLGLEDNDRRHAAARLCGFLEPDDRVGDQNVPTSIRKVVLQKI